MPSSSVRRYRQATWTPLSVARTAARAASAYYSLRTPDSSVRMDTGGMSSWGSRPNLAGGPHQSVHVGTFGGTRPANRGAGHRLLRRGLGYERITSGVASSTADNALYIGHSTWPAVTVLKAACMAIIRMAYQKLGIDLNRGNSVIPTHALATNAGFSINGTVTDLRQEYDIVSFTPGTSTVEQMATEMARLALRIMYRFFDGSTAGDSRAPVKWNVFYLNNTATTSAGVIIPLGDCLLEFAMQSKLKIQNISFNNATAADPDVDTSTNVNNITLEGFHYKGYGNHMLMKGATQVSYKAVTNEPPLVSDRDTGLLRKNPNSTLSTGPAMDITPVKPYQWQNCTRGAPIYLDAGAAKTDFISQTKRITFQNLMDKLFSGGTNTNVEPTAENGVVTQNWSNQGKFSAFGLSRLINYDAAGASATSLQVIYEVEQQVYCAVAKCFRSPAVASVIMNNNVNYFQT